MVVLLGKPLGALMTNLANGLNSLQGGSAIPLGIILDLMIAFDMGGPPNKTAYALATAGLDASASATDASELKVMAAVMLSSMVPPLALALATVLRPGLFTVPERGTGKAALAMGAAFLTEAAIPFADADPLRFIPSIMAGVRSPERSPWAWTSDSALRTAGSPSSSPSTTSCGSWSHWWRVCLWPPRW